MPNLRLVALAAAAAATAAGAWAGATAVPPAPPVRPLDVAAWRADLAEWQARRARSLTAPDGWTTVTGLHWLAPGAQTIGTAEGSAIRLASGHAPERVGTVTIENGAARFDADPLAHVEQGGEHVTGLLLASDEDGRATPSVLATGSVRFHLIERAGRLALRVRDSLAEARLHFAGLAYFAPDTAYRVAAWLERYPEGRTLELVNIVGLPERHASPGRLHFTVNGRRLALEAAQEPGDGSLFLLFRDATSRDATYPAGRFLKAPLPDADGWTVLDFNRAYNPPCVFTAFATCPLPPRENVLPVAIPAGEKRYRGHVADALALQEGR